MIRPEKNKSIRVHHRQTSARCQPVIPGIGLVSIHDQAKAKKMRKGNYMTEYLRVFSETFNKKPRRGPGYNHL